MTDDDTTGPGPPRKGDEFTRDQFDWLRQVAADITANPRAIHPSAFLLAFHIADHLNRKTRTAFPGRQRLADLIRLHVHTVTKLLHLLEARGHLSITPGHGPGQSNTYRLILKKDASTSPLKDASTSPFEPNRGHSRPKKDASTSPRSTRPRPPNCLNEPSEELSDQKSKSAGEPRVGFQDKIEERNYRQTREPGEDLAAWRGRRLREYLDLAAKMLGANSEPFARKLLAAMSGDVYLSSAALWDSYGKQDRREYIAGIIRNAAKRDADDPYTIPD